MKMGKALLSVMMTVMVAGIVKALGSGTFFDKYIRYICALLLTLGMLSPLGSLQETELTFPDFTQTEEGGKEQVPDSFLRRFEYETEEAVMQLLQEEFSLDREVCQAVAYAKDEGGVPKLFRVQVTLHTLKGAALTGDIRKRLEQACGCEVYIREDID